MIVRDTGDAWQVVLQTDHADLSGACAQQWADAGARHASLVVAAERHDDGWAVWEQSPMMDADTGRPLNFLDVAVPAHLAFYRAGIAATADEDPYAGLLVSMHGAGIYRHRYGTQPELQLTHAEEVKSLVDDFVDEQEARYADRMEASGATDDERWADYHRLQLYDRLSLFFCLEDVDAGRAHMVAGYRLTPLAPWRVRVEPYPFGERPARFSLLRRLLPKRDRTLGEFRRELLHGASERVEIEVEP